MTKQKRKVIVGYASKPWMKDCWKGDLKGIVIAKECEYPHSVQVAIMPLDDYQQEQERHKRQLEEAANLLRYAYKDCAGCPCVSKCGWKVIQGGTMCCHTLLKYLKKVKP